MVGYKDPAQVKSSVPAKKQGERKYKSKTSGPQPHLVAAAAATANANTNGVAPPPPLDEAIQVRDGSTWLQRNILQGRNAGSTMAGPSRLQSLPDPGPDERTPLDLLDEDYRPPEDYAPKYENTLTMSWDERFNTIEVQALLRAANISGEIAEFELAIRKSRNPSQVRTLRSDQSGLIRKLVKQFNDLPWDDICDILLPSTLERLPEDVVRGGRSFEDDLLRNRIAKIGGLKKSVKPGIRCGTLDSLSYHNRRVILEDFEKALKQLKSTAFRGRIARIASASNEPGDKQTVEDQTRSAEKDAKLKLAMSVPGVGKIMGFGKHLDSNAGPSMPVIGTTENPARAVPMHGDDIIDSLKSLMDASGPQAEPAPPIRTDPRKGKLITPAESSLSAGPSSSPISADIPLLYDAGKHGMPAGLISDEDEPSNLAQSAKGKKKNKKKKNKSDARSPTPTPLTLADRPSPSHLTESGHEAPVSSSSLTSGIAIVEIEPLAPASPSHASLPPPPSDMQHPLPPRPSFASVGPASTSSSYLDSLGIAQAVMDSIIGVPHSSKVPARSNATDGPSSVDVPVTFSVPPPPLDSPPPLDTAEEANIAKQELPPRTEDKLEESLIIEDVKSHAAQSRTSSLGVETRDAVTQMLSPPRPSAQTESRVDTYASSRSAEHAQPAGDKDVPSTASSLPCVFVPPPNCRARDVYGPLSWPVLSSNFVEYVDSPFDKAFGDALSKIESEQAVPQSSAILEKDTIRESLTSNVEPESKEKSTLAQKPETDEKLYSDEKFEPEVGDHSYNDDTLEIVERPRFTPPREGRRARIHSPANSDPDHNPWADVGDATFETTQIFTPFTPDDEALFASPGWTDVRRDPVTPPSPSRGPAVDDANSALLASAAINEEETIHQPRSAPESPTTRLAPTSTPGAQLAGVLESEPKGDVPETEATDVGTSADVSVGQADYVPYEELFIDRCGNIMERKAAKAREVDSPSTSADPFLVVDHSSRGNTDEEALSPDSFVQVSPVAGALVEEKPIASISYVLVPPPDVGIKSDATTSQRPVFVPRPLAPVLEEEELEEEGDLFSSATPTTEGKMKFPSGTPLYSSSAASAEAGPSGSKIASATGGRKLLDEFPVSSVRSTADWNPELEDPLAIVVYYGPEGGERRQDKGKGKGKSPFYFSDEWQEPSPSAEDLLYSSPTPVFWPLKPAGRYGRVTPDIIGMVYQHLLDDGGYRDCDCLARACRGLGLNDEWSDELVIRINEPLLDSVTLPSIKTAYRGRPESILKQQDDLFRRSERLRRITDRCKCAGYARFDGLVRFNIRGTVNKPNQPLFPHVLGVAVKSNVFKMVRDNRRLPLTKQLPSDQVNLLIGIVATAFPNPHVLCISPPPFEVFADKGLMTKEDIDELGEVAMFTRRLMVDANPNFIIFHDLKAGDFCPLPPHCSTVIELGRSPTLDPSTRTKSRSRRISQAAKDMAAFQERIDHYRGWQLTFEGVLLGIERLQGKNTVTFRYTDRIFPAKSDAPKEDYSRDFIHRMVLCRFAPTDDSKTKTKLAFFMKQNAADTEALYQAQVREFIRKEGRTEEYNALLSKARRVVRIDRSGVWSPCPGCFKSGE